MNVSLDELRRIAEVEFSDLIKDSQLLEEKLRLFLDDTSYIDLWLSRKLSDRFGFHWERGHLDNTIYRYDNFPDPSWKDITTYPRHFHNGSQEKVEAAPFDAEEIVEGFRGFMRFVESKTKEKYAESRMRKLTRERGKDWDTMSEDEREEFINELAHEDKDIAEE